jgi:NAD(P)-dependent dehydrogenase (short-subunit alcohol dehydrogenase family)
MDLELKGKTAVITGGGRGIGRGITMTLAGEGCNVVIADIIVENAEATAGDCRALGVEAMAVKCDVTDYDSARAMIDKVIGEQGQVDILVNDAAAWGNKLFLETEPGDWKREIDVCLYGVFNCSRAVLDHMVSRNYGKIISIASDAGRVGEVRQVVYSGAKAGIMGFTKALAKEMGRFNINVNVVCPSMTETDPVKASFESNPERKIKALKFYPLRRLGRPEDIANTVTFLASDRSSWVTGQCWSVNGGYAI